MSRDVVTVRLDSSAQRAKELLIAHNIRTLPVVDEAGRLAGTLGLREMTLHGEVKIAQVMREARTAKPDEPVISLVEALTDGHTHAVVIVDDDRNILGIITQTDLLATLMRLLSVKAFAAPELVSS
jgi:CBS domain-containing membrane protein